MTDVLDIPDIEMKFYAGIGSRKTPRENLRQMWDIARHLDAEDYVLRSGGAKGADLCFEKAACSVGGVPEIFLARDLLRNGIPEWTLGELRKYMDAGVTPEGMRPFIRALLCRNMMQILGPDGNSPVEFVVCWTPLRDHLGSKAGGTRYACRCAIRTAFRSTISTERKIANIGPTRLQEPNE